MSRCVEAQLFRIGGLSHQFDRCKMAGRGGETLVAREQRRAERFGKGDIDGVIGREIVPEIPHARQRNSCGYPRKGKSVRSARAARPRALSISPLAA